MNVPERAPWDWIIRGLLAALVVTNIALLSLLRTGGPLIGLGFYLVLLVFTFRSRQRDHRSVLVGGLVGLAVHMAEVVMMGWSAYPALVALNLVLPAALAVSAWSADRGPQKVTRGK
jgi:hypothetical protein